MARLRLPAAIVCASLLALAGCGGGGGGPTVEFRIPVEAAAVTTDTMEDIIVTTGTLRTRESIILSAETPGFLVLARDAQGARLVEGSVVEPGQTIARITGEDARLAARLEATRRHLEKADREMQRRQRLVEQKLIAEEDVLRAEALYEDALHDFEQSKRTVEKSVITTPIGGVVLKLARDANNLPVADGQLVAPGFEIARVAPTDQLIADIDLVGPELAKVRPGQTVRVRHYAFENITIEGRILRLSPTMDAQTHTFRAEVEIDNSAGVLRPGMFIEASIIAERRENVVVTPRQAVTQRGGRSVVFVIDGQRVVRRNVSLGLGNDDFVEVRDGVQAGERIVIHGLETLTDGTRIRVVGAS